MPSPASGSRPITHRVIGAHRPRVCPRRAARTGLLYGGLGGSLGWAWMRGTNLLRERVLVPYKLGPRHIVKGLLGGTIIGVIGCLFPETLFWAE